MIPFTSYPYVKDLIYLTVGLLAPFDALNRDQGTRTVSFLNLYASYNHFEDKTTNIANEILKIDYGQGNVSKILKSPRYSFIRGHMTSAIRKVMVIGSLTLICYLVPSPSVKTMIESLAINNLVKKILVNTLASPPLSLIEKYQIVLWTPLFLKILNACFDIASIHKGHKNHGVEKVRVYFERLSHFL